MTNPTLTVSQLINLSRPNSGASPNEAVSAAREAKRLASKHGLGGFVIAKASNHLHRAERRLARCA